METTGTPAGQSSLDDALAEVKALLERDGFTASWRLDDAGGLDFTVGATEAACVDCLVPQPVLEAIVGDALEGTGITIAAVRLPAVAG
jgi:hypothetical protein